MSSPEREEVPERPIGFVSYLRERGLTAEEWQRRIRERDPYAFELQFEWRNAYDAWLKETGRHPEFNESALAELGISLEEWRAMSTQDKLRLASRWFAEQERRQGLPIE